MALSLQRIVLKDFKVRLDVKELPFLGQIVNQEWISVSPQFRCTVQAFQTEVKAADAADVAKKNDVDLRFTTSAQLREGLLAWAHQCAAYARIGGRGLDLEMKVALVMARCPEPLG